MDRILASSARTTQILIHVWASLLYTSRSSDWLVYNQTVCFFLNNQCCWLWPAKLIIVFCWRGRLHTGRIQKLSRKDSPFTFSIWMGELGHLFFGQLAGWMKKKKGRRNNLTQTIPAEITVIENTTLWVKEDSEIPLISWNGGFW